MSTAARKVSPMQVAAQLLAEALGRVATNTTTQAEESTGDQKEGAPVPLKPIKIKRPRRARPRAEARMTDHHGTPRARPVFCGTSASPSR